MSLTSYHCSTPQFFKKHSIAPPVPDFVFRETVYVQVFWFVRTIIHPAEGDCLELHAYETTVVMSQHLSCIQDEMFYLYPQRIKTSMQAPCDESTQDERNLLLT